MRQSNARPRLGLLGGFSLTDPNGKAIKPNNIKECALLAMLALSPHGRRPRSWLQSRLWGEMSPERGAANLRQALFNLRRMPLVDVPVIGSNRSDVWLLPENLEVEPLRPNPLHDWPGSGEVLEGMDIPEESFEDWLSQVRRDFHRVERFEAGAQGNDESQAPVYSFRSPDTDADGPVRSITDHLIDSMIDAARTQTAVIVEDWRAVRNVSASPPRHHSPGDCEITVRLRYDAGRYAGFVTVLRATDRRILWSTPVELSARPGARHAGRLAWLSQCFVDFLIRNSEMAAGTNAVADRSSIAIAMAMSGLFNPGKYDMSVVRRRLDEVIGIRPTGLHHALRAMTWLYQFGDRSAQVDVAQQIREDLRDAFRLDPVNPVIHALSGQIAGFHGRSLDVALDRTAYAVRLAPDNPICMLMRATSLLYSGDSRRSYSLAMRARQTGRSTFVEPIIETTCCMAAALSGKLEKAVVHGEFAAGCSPGFRPALLHLMGSYQHLKRDEEAMAVMGQLRSRDPDFSRELLASPDYPLASDESRRFLLSGMSRYGAN